MHNVQKSATLFSKWLYQVAFQLGMYESSSFHLLCLLSSSWYCQFISSNTTIIDVLWYVILVFFFFIEVLSFFSFFFSFWQCLQHV